MKKLYSIFAAVVAVSLSAQDVVVNETFSYTGALNANGWSTHSGTAGQIVADGSVAKLIAGNSEDVNKAFSADYNINASQPNKVEYTALINIPSETGLAANTAAGDYFLMLSNQVGVTVSTFYARVFAKKGTSSSGFVLGVSNSTSTAVYSTVELPYGTDVAIKVTYSVSGANSTSVLTFGTESVSSTSATAPTVLKSIALRQNGSASSGTGNIILDNITVTTYPTGTLSVGDINKVNANFVKNTLVDNSINFAAKADVKIVNMNGQVVRTASVSENAPLNVADLTKGTYIVTAIVNGKAVSEKIIKK